MPLQLETYKANRDAELIKLCARAVQASSPVTFNSIGYPERIIDNSQIVWFADAMHEDEGQPQAVFADDFYVTDEEAALVNEVADIVEELTEKQFGIRVRPWASLLFCLNMFRLVKAMSNFAGEDLPVYEIGPGSGYLGALLVRSGHRYVATDIAEGFYLWQSRMLETMADGDFCELAEERVNGTIVDPGTKVVHVPWWIHGSYYRAKCPFNASLVVCDHAFGEMSYFGLKYTIASSKDILESYKKAFQTDPTSAFGGVIACNNEIDKKTANYMINNQFIEVLVAPSYTKEAIEILQSKPNIRVLRSNHNEIDIFENRIVNGIGLVQSSDTEDFSSMEFKHVTKISPTPEQLGDLIFAMKVAKHAKSNAIVLAKNKMTLGVGVGQMSRVISTKIAFLKAEEEGLDVRGCVLASDAFFPFRDNIDFAASKGVSHIIQPGGSVKDEEVIKAADENNLSMTFTGFRHFKH